MARVVFFYAKPRQYPNFSIPGLFEAVRSALPPRFSPETFVSSHPSNGFWKRVLLSLEARKHQGDINHITGDVHFITCFLKRQRTVLTIHDCGFMVHSSGIARFVFKWVWLAWPVRCSAAVTVVSEATKDDLLRFVRCSPDKIHVVPNFISDSFRPSPKVFHAERPLVLHIGTAPNKNLDRLIEAVSGVRCQLLIIGKLSERQQQLLNDHSVDFVNYYNATEKEIVDAYQRCDLLSFVSTLEGFGLPILEAQAVGRPVLTSSVSAMPEVAGGAAHLVDPFDVACIRRGLLRIINDANYRDRLVQKGFNNVKRYSLCQTVQGYVDVYNQLLAQQDHEN